MCFNVFYINMCFNLIRNQIYLTKSQIFTTWEKKNMLISCEILVKYDGIDYYVIWLGDSRAAP